MRTPRLTDTEISTHSETVPQWTRSGDAIAREWVFPSFIGAIQFVNAVAVAAEAADHHPDIDIRWNKVVLTLSTHDSGGLTKLDFELARTIDALP